MDVAPAAPAPKKRQSIRQKLIRAHIMLMAVMLCVLLLSALVVLVSGIRQESQYFLENNAQLVAGQLNNLVSTMVSCSNAAMLNLNQEDVLAETGPGSNELTRYNAITRQLFLVGQVYRQVDALLFIDPAGRAYSTRQELETAAAGATLDGYEETLNTAAGKSICFGVLPNTGLSLTEGGPILLMGKKVIRIETGQTLGYLYLTVQEENIAQLYENQQYTQSSQFSLRDGTGTVLSAQDKSLIGKAPAGHGRSGEFWAWNSGNPLAGYSMPVTSVNADIIYTAPVTELYANVLSLMGIILALAIIGVVIAILLAHYLSDKFSLPVLQLAEDMARVENGDLSVRCEVEADDEIGLLAEGFNRMLDNINTLLKTVKWEQKEKAKRQMALLQNQIKPHFLYNTLNTIYTLCMMDEPERAAGAAKSLAEHYRYSLSGGRNTISIKEELACVESYLDIQRLVLQDRLSVGIVCDPQLELCPIPKMTIQPIVENAILHGIKPKGAGSLLIQVSEQGPDIQIRIADDGMGMAREVCAALLEVESRSGFGLKNVMERLTLYTGTDSSIQISSNVGYGTTVTITMPRHIGNLDSGGLAV